MSSSIQEPVVASAAADERNPAPAEERAPSGAKLEDSLEEELKPEIPTSFPFTQFGEPKPIWQG
jgi:hypothetical protein